jgi:hypothetical protein
VVSAYLLSHVPPFKDVASERGMEAASNVMLQLLEASPVLTLGGPPSQLLLQGARGGGGGGEEDLSTVVYRRGRPYVNCTVCVVEVLKVFGGMGFLDGV